MLNVEIAVLDAGRELFPEQASKIVPETTLADLSLDSLDMLELKMRIEEKLDIELDIDVFEDASTLHNLATKIATSVQRFSDVGS